MIKPLLRFGSIDFQFHQTPSHELPRTVLAVIEHKGEPDAVYIQGKLIGTSPTAERLTNLIHAVGVPHSRELLPLSLNITPCPAAQNIPIDGPGSDTVANFWQGYRDKFIMAPIQLLRRLTFQ